MTFSRQTPSPLTPSPQTDTAKPGTQRGPSATKSGRLPNARLTGIDLARGIAIIGMIAVHSLVAYTEDGQPTLIYTLSAGHSSALFAMLAGVSIAILTGRAQLPRSRTSLGMVAALAVRALLIGLIGLAMGYTDIDYAVVILTYYAVMFVLAIPLAYLSSRALVVITIVGALVVPLLSQLLRPSLPDNQDAQISWGAVLHDPGQTMIRIMITGEFPVIIWMAYVSMGLVVGRLALHLARTAAYLAVTGTILAALSTVVSWMLLQPFGGQAAIEASTVMTPGEDSVQDILAFGADGTTPSDSWWWLATNAPHTGTTLDLLSTGGSALATLGLCLLIFHLPWPRLGRAVRLLVAPLVAVGTMSLTVYVAHLVFLNSDFDVYGPWSGYLRQLLVIFVFALLWKASAGRGPLEGLIRATTRRAKRVVDDLVATRTPAPSDAA